MTDRTTVFDFCRAPVDDVGQVLAEANKAHDRRVTELLDANTREVERRRLAEAERDHLRAVLAGAYPEPAEAWYRLRARFGDQVYHGTVRAPSRYEAVASFCRNRPLDPDAVITCTLIGDQPEHHAGCEIMEKLSDRCTCDQEHSDAR